METLLAVVFILTILQWMSVFSVILADHIDSKPILVINFIKFIGLITPILGIYILIKTILDAVKLEKKRHLKRKNNGKV